MKTIIIVSPSGSFEEQRLHDATIKAKDLGLEIVRNTEKRLTKPAFLNGSKIIRLKELIEAETFRADAIWCARGGVGALEFWPDYQAESYQTSTAPLIGYSDSTILHFMRFYRAKRIGIHGPIFFDLVEKSPSSIEMLHLLVDKKAELLSYPNLKSLNYFATEKISGELVVMNLTSLASLLGLFDVQFLQGKILALEEVNETHFRVFRLMQQLKNAQALSGVKAIVVGHFGDERDVIIEETLLPLAKEQGIPLFDWPIFGHILPNWPLLFGAKSTIQKIEDQSYFLRYDEQHDHTPLSLD